MSLSEVPPWDASDEETPLASFSAGDSVVDAMAAKAKGTVIERKYSTSAQWGDIVRAKVVSDEFGLSSVMLLNCWGSDSGVQIAIKTAGR